MALTNESYIVNTQTTGDIIVPVKEQVQYLNINLLGYQYYKYHEVMSQNLANIVDDIKSLQDGGLAQATFDLDALVAQSQQLISDEVRDLENGMLDRIVSLTDEAVTTSKDAIAAFNIEIHGGINANNNTVVGVVPEVENLRATVGDDDATYGLTKKVQTLYTTIGDENSPTGLVSKVNSYISLITDLTADMSPIITLIGNESSGLIQEVTLNTNRIFGGGGFDGILSIIGTVDSSGILYDISNLRQDIDVEIALSGNRLDIIEPKILTFESAIQGFTADIDNISNELGTNDNPGIKQRVYILEQQDVPNLKQIVSGAITGHTDLISGLRSELNLAKSHIETLESATTTSSSTLEDNINSSTALIAANTTAINTIETNLNNLENGKVQDNIDNIIALSSGQVLTNKNDIATMPDTIQNGILKYSNSLIFDKNVLKLMNDTTQAIETSNIITQFKTYFEVGDAYIDINQIGKDHLLLFINDNSATGFREQSYGFINDYLSANVYDLAQIERNKQSLITLNATDTVIGSVSKDILDATDPLVQKLNYLESIDPTETRSIEYIAKNHTDTLAASLATNEFATIDEKIAANITSISTLKSNTDIQLDEVKVEHARYDTLLPFMQTMFKYLNSPGTITDAEIDVIFTDITAKIEQVSIDSGAKQLDYDLLLLPGVSKFKVHVVLDKDLKFDNIVGTIADTYVQIYRRAPGDATKEAYSDPVFEPTATDALGRLIIHSGVLEVEISSNMFLSSDDSDDGAVVDLTGENASIELQIGTIDIFGQHKEIIIPIRV